MWALSSLFEKKNCIIHEVSHILCSHIYGDVKDDHGKEWTAIMKKAKEEPFVYFEDLKERKNLIKIECNCLSKYFTMEAAHKILAKGYVCHDCGVRARRASMTNVVDSPFGL